MTKLLLCVLVATAFVVGLLRYLSLREGWR